MLAAFRPTFTRAFSVSSARYQVGSQDLFESALSMVDQITYGDAANREVVVTPLSSSPSVPAPHTSLSNTTIMQIPPAEDPLLHYVASHIMKHGKRQQANRVVARTLLHIHAMTRAPPLPIFREAVFAAAPAVRIMSHRHSTKTIHKPIAISERKRSWYAVEWLMRGSDSRAGKTLEERLAREMIAVAQRDPHSAAFKKKEEIHKMAMINRGNVPKRSR